MNVANTHLSLFDRQQAFTLTRVQLQGVAKPCSEFQAHMQKIQFQDGDIWLQNLDKVGGQIFQTLLQFLCSRCICFGSYELVVRATEFLELVSWPRSAFASARGRDCCCLMHPCLCTSPGTCTLPVFLSSVLICAPMRLSLVLSAFGLQHANCTNPQSHR